MADRYFFDKRDWKRRFIKYGIIFAISFLPIVLFNIYCSKYFEKRWLLIFVDCIILLVFVVIGNYIANKIFDRKDAQLEKKQKERRALQEEKKRIMEDSYKKIREKKAENKSKQKSVTKQEKEPEIVIDDKTNKQEDNKDSNVIESKNSKDSKDASNTQKQVSSKKSNKNTKGRK